MKNNDNNDYDSYMRQIGPYRSGNYRRGDINQEFWDNIMCQTIPDAPKEAHDYLRDYATVHNVYSANTPQPNPMSNKAMFIIDTLNKIGVKYTVDIFDYDGSKIFWGHNSYSSHKLVNIIAEPNPQAIGPAIVFCAHHDVANVHSENAQDNCASVCHLLRLTSLIKDSGTNSKRTIILFSDAEEFGARGAKRFASDSKKNKENPAIIEHNRYGQIDSVVNLELTGTGTVVWSDCDSNKADSLLHLKLEEALEQNIPKLKTPPSDVIAFRRYGYPALCIGILPPDDLKDKNTWRLCHSVNDNIEGCNKKNMEDFTEFLLNITKTTTTTEHGNNNGANEEAGKSMRT